MRAKSQNPRTKTIRKGAVSVASMQPFPRRTLPQ